jgi:hypothetical protein
MTTPAMILLGVMAVVIRYLITARPYASRSCTPHAPGPPWFEMGRMSISAPSSASLRASGRGRTRTRTRLAVLTRPRGMVSVRFASRPRAARSSV